MYSVTDFPVLTGTGFPIRRSPAECLLSGSPKLIAANHVLHRHPAPRHPPFALSSLAINFFSFTAATSCIQDAFGASYPVFSFQRTPLKSLISALCFPHLRSRISTSDERNIGGGERDRTDDLLRAKQVLSQLSYTPEVWWA